MKILYTLILLCLILTPMPAKAGYDLSKGLIPEEFYGTWATPECAAPQNIMMISEHLILDALPDTNFVYRITHTKDTEGAFLAHFGNMNIYLDKTGDDKMDIAKLFLEEEHDTENPYQQTVSHRKTYQRCENINAPWPSTNKDAIGAFEALASLGKKCDGAYIEDSPACQQEVFLFADRDINGKLDHRELERLYKLAVYYGGSVACEFPHAFPGTTKSDSALFAEALLKAADRDNDDMVTLEEIKSGWNRALLEPPVNKFMRFTNDVAMLLYIIPHYPYIER